MESMTDSVFMVGRLVFNRSSDACRINASDIMRHPK